jgi:hypothetical protein
MPGYGEFGALWRYIAASELLDDETELQGA